MKINRKSMNIVQNLLKIIEKQIYIIVDINFKSNIIKVVMDKNKYALYFSRNIIPTNNENAVYYKHIGLYAFKKNTIKKITELSKSELEKIESLEQLRWLENNYKIKLAITEEDTFGIDTEEDLIKANKIVLNN